MKKFNIFITIISIIILNSSFAFADNCPFYIRGKCYNCKSNFAIKVASEKDCKEKCPNREYIEKDSSCRLKIDKENLFAAVSPSEENCPFYINGKCYDCNYGSLIKVNSKADCENRCPNRMYVEEDETCRIRVDANAVSASDLSNNNCVFYIKGKCLGCDSKLPIKVNSEAYCENRCSNRIYINDDHTCRLRADEQTLVASIEAIKNSTNDCPFPIGDKCYDCNFPHAIQLSSGISYIIHGDLKKHCTQKCSNRVYVIDDRTCRIKIKEEVEVASPTPSKEDCPFIVQGNCYNCNSKDPMKFENEDDCTKKCSNSRIYLTQDGTCRIKADNRAEFALPTPSVEECPFLIHGKCFDCNYESALKVTSQDECEAKCPNRIYVAKDKTCHIKVDDKNMSASYISPTDNCQFFIHGECYGCNSKYALKVGTQDACEKKCPNRIYIAQDRTCRLKIGENNEFNVLSEAASISDDYCVIETIEIPSSMEGYEPKKIIRNKGTKQRPVEGAYFKGENGKCYKCNTLKPVKVSKVSSEACSNDYFCHNHCEERVEKHHNSDENLYSVYKCPNDRPLMDRFMMCWSYDEENPLDLSYDTGFNNPKERYMKGPFSYKNKKELQISP